MFHNQRTNVKEQKRDYKTREKTSLRSVLGYKQEFTLEVLVNFCLVLSEFLTWSFVYKNF